MEPETLPQAGNEQTNEQASSAKEESELKRARDDAAKYRTQLRELEVKWKAAEPVLTEFQKLQDSQKSEAQKLAEQLADANKRAAEHESAAQRAQREAKLVRLATKAGVDPDVAALLDLSKLDLDNEKSALEILGKLGTARSTANSASNPERNGGSGPSDAELRQFYFGGARSKPTIFGG